MSLDHRKIVLTCITLAIAGIGTGVAVATSAGTQSVPVEEVHAVRGAAPQAAVLSALAVFRAPRGVASDGSSQGKLERLLVSATADGLPVGDADFNLARVTTIAGSRADAWIAPAGNGVCVYLPDPVDGYGAGCSTLDQVDEGKAFSILFGDLPHGAVMLAVVVADGVAAPRVVHSDGSVTSLAVHSNVAAGLLLPSDKVETGGTTLDLARFALHPTKVRAVG